MKETPIHTVADELLVMNLRAEIERLRVQWTGMKDEVNLCHEKIDRLRAALEPFARHADALSLMKALGHIKREHLLAARKARAMSSKDRILFDDAGNGITADDY